jgi:hypothetical protein
MLPLLRYFEATFEGEKMNDELGHSRFIVHNHLEIAAAMSDKLQFVDEVSADYDKLEFVGHFSGGRTKWLKVP